jgi:myo-inositol-1(or 4)-monophosphatase
MKDILDLAILTAKLAGSRIKAMREEKDFTEQIKFGYELVTSADIASNDIIIGEINRTYPSHSIISEESVNSSFSIDGPTWIIDPIDGTVGYANDHYQVSISIAFAQNGHVLVGVVYNPFLDEFFYAVKGQDAYLNGEKISVKDVSELNQCVIATGFPHKKENIPHILSYLERLLPHIRDVRRMGSAALDLCWVACGRLQGYYEGSLHSWDMAAGKLIAQEAGASVGRYAARINSELADDIYGDYLIVASPGIFDKMKSILEGKVL